MPRRIANGTRETGRAWRLREKLPPWKGGATLGNTSLDLVPGIRRQLDASAAT
jgi:hypothetical protein